MTSHLEAIFSNAFVLGGSPCSGKSTIAEMLVAEYGFHYYKADDHDPEHMRRADAERQPVTFQFIQMSWNEIWSPAPEKQCHDELIYYRERFPFILDDLSQLDTEKPVILEGAAFLPELICSFPVRRENVVFMVPTLEFQLQHYSQRPWIQSILKDCHDPKKAFENWMQRDHLFGLEVIRQAEELGYLVIVVDGSVAIQEQFERIKAQFKL